MMYSSFDGGPGLAPFFAVWVLWAVVWTVNSVLVGVVLWTLAKYLQSKTK